MEVFSMQYIELRYFKCVTLRKKTIKSQLRACWNLYQLSITFVVCHKPFNRPSILSNEMRDLHGKTHFRHVRKTRQRQTWIRAISENVVAVSLSFLKCPYICFFSKREDPGCANVRCWASFLVLTHPAPLHMHGLGKWDNKHATR